MLSAGVQAPSRNLVNFRPVADGLIRTKQDPERPALYRAGDLVHLSEQACDQIAETGVGWLLDLRSPEEVRRHGRLERLRTRIPNYTHIPIHNYQFGHLSATPGPDDYFRVYVSMLESAGEDVGRVFNFLATKARGKVLIQCFAGKDRTGIVTLLLLEVIGVPRDWIVMDFLLSGAYLARNFPHFRPNWEKRNQNPETYLPRLIPHPSTLKSLYRYLALTWDGPLGYLRAHSVDEAAFHALKTKWIFTGD